LVDVIQEQNIWRVKESRVRQPWAHLADDTCPIFFCKNLGQAIVPKDLAGLCKAFQRVPAGNEYFVTSGRALCQMLGRHERNNGAQLSEKVWWRKLNPMIQSHDKIGKHGCIHTHQLLCKKPFRFHGFLKTTRSNIGHYIGGAFVFHGSPGVVCEEPTCAVDSPSVSTLQIHERNNLAKEKKKWETDGPSEALDLTTSDKVEERKDKGKEVC